MFGMWRGCLECGMGGGVWGVGWGSRIQDRDLGSKVGFQNVRHGSGMQYKGLNIGRGSRYRTRLWM